MGGSKPALPLWQPQGEAAAATAEMTGAKPDNSINEVKRRIATGALGRTSLFTAGEAGFARNLGAG